MIHGLTVHTAQSWKLVWADFIDWTWFLVFKSSSLLARLANLARLAILASLAIDD